MMWTNDNLPEEIVFPMGPIDIVNGRVMWDERFGEEPDDIEEFILMSA